MGRKVEIKGCKNFHNGGKTVATTKQEWFKKDFKTAGLYCSPKGDSSPVLLVKLLAYHC